MLYICSFIRTYCILLMSIRKLKRTIMPIKKTPKEQSVHSQQLGKTISRLRQAYNLSLGELSEQSGVAKSIISQIEKNETNPTLSTIDRLSSALDVSVDEVLRCDSSPKFIQHQKRAGTPLLTSEDGLVTLSIIGWLKTVDWVQVYDYRSQPGGVLESEPHGTGTVENLSLFSGQVEITVGDETRLLNPDETWRYRGDLPHKLINVSNELAHATMVNIAQRISS